MIKGTTTMAAELVGQLAADANWAGLRYQPYNLLRTLVNPALCDELDKMNPCSYSIDIKIGCLAIFYPPPTIENIFGTTSVPELKMHRAVSYLRCFACLAEVQGGKYLQYAIEKVAAVEKFDLDCVLGMSSATVRCDMKVFLHLLVDNGVVATGDEFARLVWKGEQPSWQEFEILAALRFDQPRLWAENDCSRLLPVIIPRPVERRDIDLARLRFIRDRATEICVALQALRLPALILVHIIDESWQNLAHWVTFDHKWRLVAAVKHFFYRQQSTPRRYQITTNKCY